MIHKTWVVLGLAALLVSGPAFAADVSNVATATRYDLNATTTVDANGATVSLSNSIKSIPANEIRRVPDMIDKPESQIGMWVPNVEPEPVVRSANNSIGKNCRVFKNTGSDKDKYPYLIKVVEQRAGHTDDPVGKWFVYKNVKYDWQFEDAGDGEEGKPSGGKNGSSGPEVWTPFYKASGEANAITNMRNIVDGTGDRTWDPKVYANNHAKPYDSGISGTADTKGSTVLQEVGMLMTYDRAEAQVTGETGTGYYGDADPVNLDPNNFPEAKLVSVGSYESKKIENPVPDGWTMGKMTAYNRVYVEDYKSPTVKGTEVKIYGGNCGGGVTKVYVNGQWVNARGIEFETEDDNPNAAANSDRLQASMNYECGNMDIYRLDNPHYTADNPNSEPFVYFTYLPSANDQSGKTFGPYVGHAKKAEEFYYYKNIDKLWSKKPEAVVTEYIKNRYANAYSGKSLAPEYRGLVYYIIDERNSSLLKIKTLNGNLSGAAAEITEMANDYKTLGAKGAQAAADLEAFKNYIGTVANSGSYRFSYIEFKDGGRYCVGPINFEKSAETYNEVQPGQPGYDPKVKKAAWFINGARVLLPKHYAVNSQEWDQGDTPAGLNLAGQNSQFIKAKGEHWMQEVPDLMFKVDMSDCCGNTTNQVGFLKVFDNGTGTKPIPEVTISDARNQTQHDVFVPNDESLESGQALNVKDNNGQAASYDQGGKYDGDYDLTNKEISVSQNGSSIAQSPIAQSLVLADKDKAIYEDVRMNIAANAYDNIDRFMKHRGISKVSFKIEEVDANGAPTGKFESLENDKNDATATWDEASHAIVKDAKGDYANFDPALKFYHIFRNPGLYKVSYAASDVPQPGQAAQTQIMAFKVKVLNQSSDVRTIDTDQKRQ
ncbi:MAG: hypothetical protein WA705_28705 [Candidatus Ozemobacteraceae bacterium]